MNVLVVDDEPIIRIGLRTLVEWERHGLTLAGEAADGAEALERIRQGDIDLVVTDIKMPRMDGLELIRSAFTVTGDIAFLVLSCLDDFDYVKEAMKLGAKDYILKPTMEPEELIRILQSIKEQLEAERTVRRQLDAWRTEFEQTRQYQLAQKVKAFLEFGQDQGGLHPDLFGSCPALLSIVIYGTPKMKRIYDQLDTGESITAFHWENDGFFILYPAEAGRADHRRSEAIVALREQLERECSDIPGWLICSGPEFSELEQLRQRAELHRSQLYEWFYTDIRRNVMTDPPTLKPTGADLPYEVRNDLLKALYHENGQAFLYLTERLCASFEEMKPAIPKLHQFVFELISTAAGYARELGFTQVADFERKYASIETVRRQNHLELVSQWLTEAFMDLLGTRWGDSALPASSNPFVRKAIKFMMEHYRRNIGASDIAEHVKLSRSYLSDLFSRETGDSLIETLTRIRIEEAKKMLRAGEKKIYEVAEEVGFYDPKTFAKTFRRMVGCSPKEFESNRKL